MTFLAAGLAGLSLGLLAWSYLVYPPLIAWMAARRPAAPEAGAPLPESAEVLVSAADEEEVIGRRVRDLLAQDGVPGYRITIGCDGCRDATAARAREAAAGAGNVRIVEFPERRGKAAVLNDLVQASTAEVLVFTDANTRFEPGAVRTLLESVAAPGVGAACGRLVFETPSGGRPTPESAYWDRETRLKESEGALGACLGANGGIYAARRAFVRPLPPDTTSMDDFLIPVRAARGGARVVFAGRAVAREDAARDAAAEVSRRLRIGIGAGQVLRRELWLWNAAAHPALTLAYFSRKAARWLAPLAALAAAVAALFVPGGRTAGACALGAAALLILSARLRPALSGPLGRLYYFAVLNVALALGVAAGLLGHSRPFWARTARS